MANSPLKEYLKYSIAAQIFGVKLCSGGTILFFILTGSKVFAPISSEHGESNDFGKAIDFMDSEEMKRMVISFIWTGQEDSLKKFCDERWEMPIFLQKVIDEIKPGNEHNDALYFIARKIIETNPESYGLHAWQLETKTDLVKNPNAKKDLLVPYIALDTLSKEEFIYIVEVILKTEPLFMGLSKLVRENPNKTRGFVLQVLELQASKDIKIERGSSLYNLLCKAGILYRNHHYSSELLDKINNALGGVGDFIEKEKTPRFMVLEDISPFDYIKNKLDEARALLVALKYDKALEILKREVKVSNILMSDSYVFQYRDTGAYPDIILFYALVEFRNGNFRDGNLALEELLNRGRESYFYAEFLKDSDEKILKNKDLIDQTFLSFGEVNNIKFSFDVYVNNPH